MFCFEKILLFVIFVFNLINWSFQMGQQCYGIASVFENRTACKFEAGDMLHYCFMGEFQNDHLCERIPPVYFGHALGFVVQPIYQESFEPCPGCKLNNAFLPYSSDAKFEAYIAWREIYNITNNFEVFSVDFSFPDLQSGCNCTNDFCKCSYLGMHFNLSSLNDTFNATINLKIGHPVCSLGSNIFQYVDYDDHMTDYAGESQDTLCPDCCDCSVCPPVCQGCSGAEESNPCYLMTKQCGYEGATTTPEIQTDSGVSTTPEIQAVDGSWSDWQPWSTCTTECLQQRTRNCDLPAPQNNGLPCVGSSMQSANCTGDSCNTATVTQDANATAVTVTQDGNATGLNATVEAVGKNTTMEPEATTDPSSIVKAAKNLIFAVLIIKIISTFCV